RRRAAPPLHGHPHDRRLGLEPRRRGYPASRSLLPTGWLHPQRAAANEPSHFEPDTEYLEELIAEDRRRSRRRRIIGAGLSVLLIAAIVAAGALFY
ncbi:MAG: hypothetical protein ACTIH8_05170, partial [Microbacterium gubbeenense]